MSPSPALSSVDVESNLGSFNKHITLLTAQSAVVREKRRNLRERQRVHTTALAFLDIPAKYSFAESEGSDDSVWTLYEQSNSRFSHSLLSLEIQTSDMPVPEPKRKSMIAKLLDGKLRPFQSPASKASKRSAKQ